MISPSPDTKSHIVNCFIMYFSQFHVCQQFNDFICSYNEHFKPMNTSNPISNLISFSVEVHGKQSNMAYYSNTLHMLLITSSSINLCLLLVIGFQMSLH